jgi:hypothetical protein
MAAPSTLLTCGLIGLPASGKSTLFALLTGLAGRQASTGAGETRRVVRVPDPRVDALVSHFGPKKTTHAQIEIVDIPGLVPGEKGRTAHFLEAVRGSDALIYVLRGFDDGQTGHPGPISELGALEAELTLADLIMVENRIERLENPARKIDGPVHVSRKDTTVHATLCRLRDHLAEGLSFSDFVPRPEEAEVLANLASLSAKPAVWVLNLAEANLGDEAAAGLSQAAGERGVPLVSVSARVEREIAELPPLDAAAFLTDLGLDESGLARLVRAVYSRLGLISFLTTGRDEVRAWTLRRGTAAKVAAGKIHSDIERGFIRVEVIGFTDYVTAVKAAAARPGQGGSANLGERAFVEAKEKALMRLEGKDYIVRDGDILDFRFNV